MVDLIIPTDDSLTTVTVDKAGTVTKLEVIDIHDLFQQSLADCEKAQRDKSDWPAFFLVRFKAKYNFTLPSRTVITALVELSLERLKEYKKKYCPGSKPTQPSESQSTPVENTFDG